LYWIFIFEIIFFPAALYTHNPAKIIPNIFFLFYISRHTHTQADTHTTPSYFIYDNVVVQCVSLLQKKWKKTLKKKAKTWKNWSKNKSTKKLCYILFYFILKKKYIFFQA
jgi:hypothetical protein